MANCIGYEELMVGDRPVGPTQSILLQLGEAMCAVFYVDPGAPGPVNWLSTFGKQDTVSGVPERDVDNEVIRTLSTRNHGFPLAPDRAITVAGPATISNTLFIRTGPKGGARKVHALYFDKVDVVAADFVGATSLAAIESVLLRIEKQNTDRLTELKKQTTALESGVDDWK